MKHLSRAFAALLAVLLACLAFAAPAMADAKGNTHDRFADAGQQTHDIRATYTKITLDGKVSKGEYNADPIKVKVGDPGVNWMNWSVGFPDEEINEIIPYGMTYYVTFNKTGLYVAAEITEPSHFCDDGSPAGLWTMDCLEIDCSVDAYGDREKGEYDETAMLDRVRSTYALVDDGDDSYAVGYCYTPSSYSDYYEQEMLDEDVCCVAREGEVTTYEVLIPWERLYLEDKAPEQVYMNFQLHIADERYGEYCDAGYNYCLGGIRYAVMLDDEQKADFDTDNSMILHIFNLTDYANVNSGATAPLEDDETVEEPTEGEKPTEAPTAAPTEAPTAAPTEAPTDAATVAETVTEAGSEAATETPAGGCASAFGAYAVLLSVLAAAVLRKKKD